MPPPNCSHARGQEVYHAINAKPARNKKFPSQIAHQGCGNWVSATSCPVGWGVVGHGMDSVNAPLVCDWAHGCAITSSISGFWDGGRGACSVAGTEMGERTRRFRRGVEHGDGADERARARELLLSEREEAPEQERPAHHRSVPSRSFLSLLLSTQLPHAQGTRSSRRNYCQNGQGQEV